jgi:hypothetical protein
MAEIIVTGLGDVCASSVTTELVDAARILAFEDAKRKAKQYAAMAGLEGVILVRCHEYGWHIAQEKIRVSIQATFSAV